MRLPPDAWRFFPPPSQRHFIALPIEKHVAFDYHRVEKKTGQERDRLP